MKGIEWIKITTNMCEDEKIRLLDSMDIRDVGIYLWLRLLLQAGKTNDNGLIYLKREVPYTKQMLSILFNRPVDIIEKVFEVLKAFQMIEIYENNIIKICNWEKHQNIEGMKKVREGTRERVKNFRERKKEEEISKKEPPEKVKDKNCNAHVTLQKEKREEDNKNKKKNIDIRERGEDNKKKDIDIDIRENEEELDAQALKLMKSLEKINININGLTLEKTQDMLANHKERYVKMAMGKAIERNKLDTNYINGILKNWLREGYPKTYEEMEFSDSKGGNLLAIKEKPHLRFINFEAREYDYKDLEKKLLGW